MSSSKNFSPDSVWFVTGCSSGLGTALATYISQAGYNLVATARNTRSLSYLADSPKTLKLPLDVTSPAEISSAIAAAVEKFGHIDVVINNAGYGLGGDFEATTDADARKQVETNLWGRKFGLEGFTEAVAKEMHPDWNIQFMIAEPGGMKTEYSGTSMVLGARHPAYLDLGCPYNQLAAYMADPKSKEAWADPGVVARVLFDTVAHKGDKALPLRLPLGSDAWGMIRAENEAVNKLLDEWRSVSESCSSAEQLESVAFLQK